MFRVLALFSFPVVVPGPRESSAHQPVVHKSHIADLWLLTVPRGYDWIPTGHQVSQHSSKCKPFQSNALKVFPVISGSSSLGNDNYLPLTLSLTPLMLCLHFHILCFCPQTHSPGSLPLQHYNIIFRPNSVIFIWFSSTKTPLLPEILFPEFISNYKNM